MWLCQSYSAIAVQLNSTWLVWHAALSWVIETLYITAVYGRRGGERGVQPILKHENVHHMSFLNPTAPLISMHCTYCHCLIYQLQWAHGDGLSLPIIGSHYPLATCWHALFQMLEIASCADTLGIRLPIDFAIFYQIAQSTSGTESYSEGFTLIASIIHKIVSSTVSERT